MKTMASGLKLKESVVEVLDTGYVEGSRLAVTYLDRMYDRLHFGRSYHNQAANNPRVLACYTCRCTDQEMLSLRIGCGACGSELVVNTALMSWFRL